MFDAWMSAWERIAKAAPHPMGLPRTAYPKPQDWLPVVQPAMVPAAAGMAAWNAGTASWVGLWMGFARAPLAAYETLAGSAVAAPVAKSAPAVVARTAAPKAATPKQAKPKAVSAPAKAAAATAKPKAATKAKAAAKAQAAPKAKTPVDDRPTGLAAPRAGKADDLKRISGVGPKLETVLNDLGIYHFDQIAGWKKAQIDWVDDYLRFKGRIERDGWIKQAKALAKEVA